MSCTIACSIWSCVLLAYQSLFRSACNYAALYNHLHLSEADCTTTSSGDFPVQNPVNTIVWLVANYSLLAPLTTFAQDVQLFAIPLQQRKPQLLLSLTFMILSYLAILCGPATHANLFHLYTFIPSFRLQVTGIVLAQFSVCATLLIGIKQLVDLEGWFHYWPTWYYLLGSFLTS